MSSQLKDCNHQYGGRWIDRNPTTLCMKCDTVLPLVSSPFKCVYDLGLVILSIHLSARRYIRLNIRPFSGWGSA